MTDGTMKKQTIFQKVEKCSTSVSFSRFVSRGSQPSLLHQYQEAPLTIEQLCHPIAQLSHTSSIFTPNSTNGSLCRIKTEYPTISSLQQKETSIQIDKPELSSFFEPKKDILASSKRIYTISHLLDQRNSKSPSELDIILTKRKGSSSDISKAQSPQVLSQQNNRIGTAGPQKITILSLKDSLRLGQPNNQYFKNSSGNSSPIKNTNSHKLENSQSNFFRSTKGLIRDQMNTKGKEDHPNLHLSAFRRVSNKSQQLQISLPSEQTPINMFTSQPFSIGEFGKIDNSPNRFEQLSPIIMKRGNHLNFQTAFGLQEGTSLTTSRNLSKLKSQFQIKVSATATPKNNLKQTSATNLSISPQNDMSSQFVKMERTPSKLLAKVFRANQSKENSIFNQDFKNNSSSNFLNTLNSHDSSFPWSSQSTWKPIVDESISQLKNGQISFTGSFQWSLLEDFLYCMTSLAHSKLNPLIRQIEFQKDIPTKYMLESLKSTGFTPDFSENVCKVISQVMITTFNVSSPIIGVFQRSYTKYEDIHLKWSSLDRIGGGKRVNQISDYFFIYIQRDQTASTQFRQLDITVQTVQSTLEKLFSQNDSLNKDYFKQIKQFFRLPVFRVSTTMFFQIRHVYLKNAFSRAKLPIFLRNRISLLLEQMRAFVVTPLSQDLPAIMESSNCNEGVQTWNNRISSQIYINLISRFSIKQELIKSPKSIGSKSALMAAISSLIRIFCLNNHESVMFYSLLQIEQLASVLLLNGEIFTLFAKSLIESLNSEGMSKLFIQDTHSRLQFSRVLVFRARRCEGNLFGEDSCFSIEENINSNYLMQGCYFNELFQGMNYEKDILETLTQQVLTSETLQALYSFDKSNRCEDHCSYLLSYFYSITEISSSRPKQFISSFDFQQYVTSKKLTLTYFKEFKRIFKEVIEQSHLGFNELLTNRILQEYSYSLTALDFYPEKQEIKSEDPGNLKLTRKMIIQRTLKQNFLQSTQKSVQFTESSVFE